MIRAFEILFMPSWLETFARDRDRVNDSNLYPVGEDQRLPSRPLQKSRVGSHGLETEVASVLEAEVRRVLCSLSGW